MADGLARFDAITARLARLPHRHQVAFAAGCAERALALLEYDGFPGCPDFLRAFRAAVDAVWSAATGPAALLDAATAAVEAVFPEGDHYAGYDGTVGAGAAVLRALDAAADPSGRAAADAGLHVASAYRQVTQWDDPPADEFGWQDLAVGVLEGLGGRPVSRQVFAGLPPPHRLGAE